MNKPSKIEFAIFIVIPCLREAFILALIAVFVRHSVYVEYVENLVISMTWCRSLTVQHIRTSKDC